MKRNSYLFTTATLRAILYLFLLVSGTVRAQDEKSAANDPKSEAQFRFSERHFEVIADDGIIYSSKEFAGPINHLFIDFNSDGTEELFIEETQKINKQNFYYTYIYATGDSVFLIDSIGSGIMKPYHEFSEEFNSLILVTGDVYVDLLITLSPGKTLISPKVYWLYDGKEFFSIEEEMYDEYLAENEELILTLPALKKEHSEDCAFAKNYRGLLLTIYMNYIFANELTLANKFISNYYNCEDFKQIIDNLNEIY